MKRPTLTEATAFVVLFVGGVALRWQMRDLPNFAPVSALALFAGFYFRSWLLAAALPLSIMAVSDLWIGGYDWQMMLLVYSMLALPVACRSLIRYPRVQSLRNTGGWLARVFAGSLSASCAFFLVTNFGAWLWFDMYDRSWVGLLECYAAALPFFRHTLAGDVIFAVALFGSYAAAASWGLVRSSDVMCESAT